MLSGRVWFERFPRQLRLLVALLALLSFVAPTWHICELGGHVHPMSAAMHHEQRFQRSVSGALICFCAPRRHSEEPPTSKFHFAARMNMAHDVGCLALLLGAMPGMWASPMRIARVSTLVIAPFAARREFPTRRFVRTFSGRGPPVAFAFAL